MLRYLFSGLIVFLILLSSFFDLKAQAATITVNTIADYQTANGNCTLHEAMTATNTNTTVDSCIAGEYGDDTLDLRGIQGGIYLTMNLPFTEEDMTIIGPGSENLIVHGNGINDSIFRIKSLGGQVTVDISGIRITGGNITGNGGAIYVYPTNTLNLVSCSIDHNTADLDGSGIINDQGNLSLDNCDVIYNTDAKRGGGIANVSGNLTITNSRISNNTPVEDGGGIWNYNGVVEINKSTIGTNTAGNQGGGIYSNYGASDEMTLLESAITGNNTLSHSAGGIWNGAKMRLYRVTISQNKTPDLYDGGGIHNDGAIIIEESTISGNTSNESIGGILTQGRATLVNTTISSNIGSGFFNSGADTAEAELTNCTIVLNTGVGITNLRSLTLNDSLVADNTLFDCSPTSKPSLYNGFNLDSDNTCGLTGPGDLPGIDPLLGPLADNGGPTLTHALQRRSPAIDAADNTGCPATDQRGIERPNDGNRDGNAVCDIGSYEAVPSKAIPWMPLLLEK